MAGRRVAAAPAAGGVVVRDGPAGPRAVLQASGLDVWEVVQALRTHGNDLRRTAAYLAVGPAEVEAALAAAAADPGAVSARIASELALAGRELVLADPGASAPGARALIDRAITPAVAEGLRRAHRDAVSAADDPDLAELDEAALVAHARSEGRVLVTHAAGDHLPLARAAAATGARPGVILVSPVTYPRTTLCVERVVLALDAMLGEPDPEAPAGALVRWLERPPGCPFHPPG